MTDSGLVIISAAAVCALEIFEFASANREGGAVFSMKWHIHAIEFFLIAFSLFWTLDLRHVTGNSPKDPPYWVPPLLLLGFLLARPNTIVAGISGLTSFSFYGLRRRRLPWGSVANVTSEWQEEAGPMRGWPRSMGYSVDVFGSDGTKITHGIMLRHQSRFLDALRQHLPASVFAPGIYDWHPERL